MWYISLFIFIFGSLLAYCNIKFSYWKRKQIATFPAKIPWGSFKNLLDHNIEQQVEAFHKYFRHLRAHFAGIYLFTRPVFLPVNARLVYNVLVRDARHFGAHGAYHNTRAQKISGHVYNSAGWKWRMLSIRVTAMLRYRSIKRLLPTVVDSYTPLVGVLELYASLEQSVCAKNLVENITRDVFTNCVLGMDAHEDFKWFEDSIFIKSRTEIVRDHLRRMYPNLARYYGVLNYPREAEEFFARTVLKYIKKRHKNSIVHTDFLQLLMELHEHDHDVEHLAEGAKLDMYDIINQCFFFYLHGFRTATHTLSFALYEIARNQYVQNKIRMEVIHIGEKRFNVWGMDELGELTYLEQVLKEILRKYPPIKVLERKCTRRYKLPNDDKYIERGTNVLISVAGMHKDEAFYPDAEKFEPDRFREKFREKYEKQSVYLPFGDGPRLCPGKRFALTQLKVALVMIIQKFQFYLTPGGTNPLENGLMLRFHQIKYNT